MVITSTIKLDYCWVCGSLEGLHDHHLVPKSCGGTHGPTVTLCASHHNIIHRLAYYKDALVLEESLKIHGQDNYPKLKYLVSVIQLAFSTTKDVNKRIQLNVKLDQVSSDQLRYLTKALKLSQAKVVELALHTLAEKYP